MLIRVSAATGVDRAVASVGREWEWKGRGRIVTYHADEDKWMDVRLNKYLRAHRHQPWHASIT